MIVALPFELFFIPVMYTLVEDGIEWMKRLVGMSHGTDAGGAEQ